MSEATLQELPAAPGEIPASKPSGPPVVPPEAPAAAMPARRPAQRPRWRIGLWFFLSLLAHLALFALPCVILAGLWFTWRSHRQQLKDEQAAARAAEKQAQESNQLLKTELSAALAKLEQQLDELKQGVQGAARSTDLAGVRDKLDSRFSEVDGAIGGVKSLSERMQPEAPYPAAPPQLGCDVMVLALNSRRLDIKQYMREFETLRGNVQLQTYYPRYRLAAHVVTTNEWETLLPMGAATFPASVFRPLDGSDATERIDDVASQLAEKFPKGPAAARRCVLLVSTECEPPQNAGAWSGVGVDVILIGKQPQAELAEAWQQFCVKHAGRRWIVQTAPGDNTEARQRVSYLLRQLTHPLVVFLNS